jgi:hypothetical protein
LGQDKKWQMQVIGAVFIFFRHIGRISVNGKLSFVPCRTGFFIYDGGGR